MKNKTLDLGNNESIMKFTEKVFVHICECGFNPDCFQKRDGYLDRAIGDLEHDANLCDRNFPDLAMEHRDALLEMKQMKNGKKTS